MKFKFKCEYDGTDFHGFQKQKNGISVQQVLEEALSKYFQCNIEIVASGRTDKGVHATGQVCSFDLSDDYTPRFCARLKNKEDKFKVEIGVNSFLPSSVAIRDFEIAEENFHARFSAMAKTYTYKCSVSPVRSPLRDRFMVQLYKMPDIKVIQALASYLVGTHDFSALSNPNTARENKIRTIKLFEVKLINDEIIFNITGNSFLRNMVRIIVGTLLEIGYSGMNVPDAIAYIEKVIVSKDRKMAGKTADAKGLCLVSVVY